MEIVPDILEQLMHANIFVVRWRTHGRTKRTCFGNPRSPVSVQFTKNKVKMLFEIVVAHNAERGIGLNNSIPWKCEEDVNFFKDITSSGNNAVIMGTNTWRSIGSRPLPGRLNVVISSMLDEALGASMYRSVEECITSIINKGDQLDRAFVIGGESIYKQFLETGVVSIIHANEILSDDTKCDRFFCAIPPCFNKEMDYTSKTHNVRYTRYRCEVNSDERQYLDLVKHVLLKGERRSDRTGTGTLSVFGNTMRFSLREGKVPLLTTKRVFWKGVVEELLWMISGSTDAKKLSDKGVNIWNGNSSREFLDSAGFFERSVGDVGPLYGFQWRHFGADYVDCNTDYTGQGFDQLAACIDAIKRDPFSRRILLSAWNPSDLGKMNLPPCHVMAQFFVSGEELSCMVFQRSVDIGLGLPFNIASYGLLTHMIAQCCGLKAKELVHSGGDNHIYCDHVEALMRQTTRSPLKFPMVRLNPDVRDIGDFSGGDIQLHGYVSYPPIKMAFSA